MFAHQLKSEVGSWYSLSHQSYAGFYKLSDSTKPISVELTITTIDCQFKSRTNQSNVVRHCCCISDYWTSTRFSDSWIWIFGKRKIEQNPSQPKYKSMWSTLRLMKPPINLLLINFGAYISQYVESQNCKLSEIIIPSCEILHFENSVQYKTLELQISTILRHYFIRLCTLSLILLN